MYIYACIDIYTYICIHTNTCTHSHVNRNIIKYKGQFDMKFNIDGKGK